MKETTYISKSSKKLMNATIFLGGIPIQYTEDKLFAYFSKYGEIDNLLVKKKDPNDKFNLGFGYIEADERTTQLILQSTYHIVDGRKIECQPFMKNGMNKFDHIKSKISRTLYAYGIPNSWNTKNLKKFFGRFGDLINIYFLPMRMEKEDNDDLENSYDSFDDIIGKRAFVLYKKVGDADEVVSMAKKNRLGYSIVIRRKDKKLTNINAKVKKLRKKGSDKKNIVGQYKWEKKDTGKIDQENNFSHKNKRIITRNNKKNNNLTRKQKEGLDLSWDVKDSRGRRDESFYSKCGDNSNDNHSDKKEGNAQLAQDQSIYQPISQEFQHELKSNEKSDQKNQTLSNDLLIGQSGMNEVEKSPELAAPVFAQQKEGRHLDIIQGKKHQNGSLCYQGESREIPQIEKNNMNVFDHLSLQKASGDYQADQANIVTKGVHWMSNYLYDEELDHNIRPTSPAYHHKLIWGCHRRPNIRLNPVKKLYHSMNRMFASRNLY